MRNKDKKKRSVVLELLRYAVLLSFISLGLAVIVATDNSSSNGHDSTVNVDASDNGSQVTLAVGDLLVVTLDSNATTGFTWNLSGISNETVIEKISDEYIAPPEQNGVVGQGGQEKWTFEALVEGTADISMEYTRSWEDPPVPAETFDITVIVE